MDNPEPAPPTRPDVASEPAPPSPFDAAPGTDPVHPAAAPLVIATDAPDTLEQTAPRKRRHGVAWLVGIGATVLVIAGIVAVQVSANRTFDAAHAGLLRAADTGAETVESLDETTTSARSRLLSAGQIVESAADDLVDPAARGAFQSAIDANALDADAADALLDAGVDDGAAEKPFFAWELWGAASALDQRTDAAGETSDAMIGAQTQLDTAADALQTAAAALYASAAPAATALEAANVSAVALTVLDFRDAADAVAVQSIVGSGAAVAFSTYAQRAQAMKDSAVSELAEKQGPLLAKRLEIEEYARSISGGVVLDFDWAQTAAGVGGADGIGGTATWNTARGGFSTITFSHSVAQWWPAADARALVAHEVGHAITSKCHEMFDSADQDANEEWATAWAISMGHTAEGNGVQAYGYPSQAMIDIAATCR